MNARPDDPPPVAVLRERFRLTPREAEIAIMLYYRRTDAEIARGLRISIKTVQTHVRSTLLKLGAGNRRGVEDALRLRT